MEPVSSVSMGKTGGRGTEKRDYRHHWARKGGRPKLVTSSGKVSMAKKLYADKTYTISEICKTLNISRASLYRYINSGGGNVAKP